MGRKMDHRIIVIFLIFGCITGYRSQEDAHTEVPPADPATSLSPHVPDHHDQHETSTAHLDSEAEEHHQPEHEHHRQLTQPIHHPPEPESPTAGFNNDHESQFPVAEVLPPKTSIQDTFTFTSVQRCLNFLHRLKSKAQNEHVDHPLKCNAAFDGILCWRPADPGETLLQACPEGSTSLKAYAKRQCVDGHWRVYEHANDRLGHYSSEITQTDFADCIIITKFAKKYAPQPTSAELRGPGEGLDVYGIPTDSSSHYVQPKPMPRENATAASTWSVFDALVSLSNATSNATEPF